jgi:hypothetical protein
VLLDTQADLQWDKKVSTFLLAQVLSQQQQQASTAATTEHASPLQWTKELLGQYISCVRSRCAALELSLEARLLLVSAAVCLCWLLSHGDWVHH